MLESVQHRRLVSALFLTIGLVLAVAGVATWRMFWALPKGTATYGPSRVTFLFTPGPHRLHPLRAELLWGAGVVCVITSVALATWRPGRPRHTSGI
jgi:hypothetical protein